MTVGTSAQTGVDTSVDVLDANGQKTGTANLPADVFGVQTNVPLIHQVVVAQQAAARQGTHSTKTRGEVRGGGKKPYRQKGTGRARQGSLRAPQFTGGGTVHGPTPRDYTQRTPKKMKTAALRGALSDRARHGCVHVLSSLVTGDAPSTKAALSAVAAVTDRANVLVVLQREDELGWKSLRNAAGIHVIVSDQLNTYDVLCADDVVFTEGGLAEFLAGSGGTSPASGRYPHRLRGRKGKGAKATEDETQRVFASDPGESQDAAAADDAAGEYDVEAGK